MLRIGKEHADKMVDHAWDEDPNECCGILAGEGGVVLHLYQITNSARSPFRYLMDPQQFLNADRDSEKNGWEFLAFYHSHTHSPAYPSQTDVRMALESGWLDILYIVVSLENKTSPQIRAFRITDDGDIVEEEFQLG